MGLLIRLRLRLLLRRTLTGYTREARIAAPLRLLLAIFLGMTFLGVLVVGLSVVLSLEVHGPHGLSLFGSSVTWGLSITGVFVFVYALLAMLALFTYSSDLDLLLLTPLSPRLILGDKLLTVTGGFFILLVFTGAPVLIGTGHLLHFGWQYDLATVTALLLVPVAPVSLAMVLILASLRWFPPRRARLIVVATGTIIFALFYAGARAANVYSDRLPSSFSHLTGAWGFVPITWPGHFLSAVGLGQTGTALLYFQATLGLACVAAWLTVELSSYMFVVGWTGYPSLGTRDRPGLGGSLVSETNAMAAQPREGQSILARRGSVIAWWPILHKEWLLFRRDPQVIGQVALPLVVAVFTIQRAFLNGTPIYSSATVNRDSAAAWFCGSLALSSFFLLSYLALSIVNREGRSLQLLALAPLTARDILIGKWAFCVTPILAAEEILLVAGAVTLHFSTAETLIAALSLAALVVALCGALITISLWWPRLHADAARRPVSFAGCLTGSVFGAALVGTVTACLLTTFVLWGSTPILAIVAMGGSVAIPIGVTALVISMTPRVLRALLMSDAKPQ
jgi:ABC-2 type transport system permease protein